MLLATLSQEFRSANPEFDSNEIKITRAGAFNTFARQSQGAMSFITDDLRQKAGVSMGRALKMPVLNYKDVTIRSTRPITIAADENTSAFYTVVFTTLAYGFRMYPRQHFNNDIDYQMDFNHKMRAFISKLMSTLDGMAVTALDAGKTQIIGGVEGGAAASGVTTVGGHEWEEDVVSEIGVGAKLKDSVILHDLGSIMISNDFEPNRMDIVGNQGLRSIASRMEGFGTYNSENRAYLLDGYNWSFSNAISNAAGKSATAYAIEDGTLGMLTRVTPDSIYGTTTGDGHRWDQVNLPGLNFNVGTYEYDEVVSLGDTEPNDLGAGTEYLTRTAMEVVDFSFDIALFTKYNSAPATIPSGIVKFDIAV